MSKIAVIYESKYGTTKKYAQWISTSLSSEIYEKSSIKSSNLKEYDTIIYGGGMYAGGISGISIITKNFDIIKDKNIIVFTCGLADPKEESNLVSIKKGIEKVFTKDMIDKIKFFHLRGGIDYKKLSFMHKSMMKMLKKMVSKKSENELREEDKQFLDTYGKVVDFTNKETITPIISYVKNL